MSLRLKFFVYLSSIVQDSNIVDFFENCTEKAGGVSQHFFAFAKLCGSNGIWCGLAVRICLLIFETQTTEFLET